MSQTYRNISFFILLVIVGVQWGFYKPYSSQFPDVVDNTMVVHIHGALWMTWLVMLVGAKPQRFAKNFAVLCIIASSRLRTKDLSSEW